MNRRKNDHIELAPKSQINPDRIDNRFLYEPMLSPHPAGERGFVFLGKKFSAPLWISSMTGGTAQALEINRLLAGICAEFGLGMGLGSCRVLLDDDQYFSHFDLRDIIGEDRAFFANLGVAQIEKAIGTNRLQKIHDLVSRLRADGLIIHVNPLQEWIQPEGNRFKRSPADTIERFIEHADYKIIIKEVGQGFGPKSIERLLKMPVEAIEFAAFGGTNFSKVELIRRKEDKHNVYEPLSRIGVDAGTMLNYVNSYVAAGLKIRTGQLIISGGISNFLDGYYLINKSILPAIYGQASAFLTFAKKGYEPLHDFVDNQVKALRLAKAYLHVKENSKHG
ncbi:MAG: hypothetical protein PVF73_10765 [Bacteroidales bacterium]